MNALILFELYVALERCHTSNRNQQSQEQENHVAVVEEEVEDVLKDEDKAAELLNLI